MVKSSRLQILRKDKPKIVIIYLLLFLFTGLLIYASTVLSHLSPIINGLGIVVFILGLRHGVDVDHIAAIDNTTRKLIQEGKSSSTVGTWFSLGHSTVVIGFVALLVLLTRSLAGKIPTIQTVGGIIGLVTSGVFLIIIGLVNLVIVIGIYRMFRNARDSKFDEARLDDFLSKRGLLSRIFRRFFNFVNEPWQIYPIGILFGLGFDTATEVALIAISIGIGVSSVVPVWQIMILPLLFTCGMVLTDTTDGVAMRLAYGWAFLNPLKKIFYNLTISIMSVVVALGIGGIELLQIVGNQFNLNSFFWIQLKGLNFETMGLVIIGIFGITWALGYVVWKVRGYDRISMMAKEASGNSKR